MKGITREQIRDLTVKIDGMIELELGVRLPQVTLIATFEGELALFTNRRSNEEVRAMLETALEAIKGNPDGRF